MLRPSRLFPLFGILIFIFSCSGDKKKPGQQPVPSATPAFFFLDSGEIKKHPRLLRLAQIVEFDPPALTFFKKINTNWRYGPGDPENGLLADFRKKPRMDTVINLPHRINQPDWPFWYEQKFHFGEAALLFAEGDDGVQCFLNGERRQPVSGSFFRKPASGDSITVTLRVLNNALNGGLREVAWVQPAEFEKYLIHQKLSGLRRQLFFLAFTYENELDETDWNNLETVLQHPDTAALLAAIQRFPPLKMPRLEQERHLRSDTDTFAFTAWGDSQGGWQTFRELARRMAAEETRFSIGLGDLVSNGCDENQWLSFRLCLQPLLQKQPVFSIAGNHDYDGYYNDLQPVFYKDFILGNREQKTYFSWTCNNAIFVALDPNEAFPLAIAGAQRIWLSDRMNSPEWQQADWRFLLIHQPPYSQGWPGYHGDEFIREIVDSMAEEKRIDFVLSGHSHDYERLTRTYGSQRTHFFVLGGAGGSLEPPESSDFPRMDTVIKKHHYARFEVTGREVNVTILGTDGEVLDRWDFRKKQ